jgi:hypothetical protein
MSQHCALIDLLEPFIQQKIDEEKEVIYLALLVDLSINRKSRVAAR